MADYGPICGTCGQAAVFTPVTGRYGVLGLVVTCAACARDAASGEPVMRVGCGAAVRARRKRERQARRRGRR